MWNWRYSCHQGGCYEWASHTILGIVNMFILIIPVDSGMFRVRSGPPETKCKTATYCWACSLKSTLKNATFNVKTLDAYRCKTALLKHPNTYKYNLHVHFSTQTVSTLNIVTVEPNKRLRGNHYFLSNNGLHGDLSAQLPKCWRKTSNLHYTLYNGPPRTGFGHLAGHLSGQAH